MNGITGKLGPTTWLDLCFQYLSISFNVFMQFHAHVEVPSERRYHSDTIKIFCGELAENLVVSRADTQVGNQTCCCILQKSHFVSGTCLWQNKPRPIHGYPSANDIVLPRLLDFGSVAIGTHGARHCHDHKEFNKILYIYI